MVQHDTMYCNTVFRLAFIADFSSKSSSRKLHHHHLLVVVNFVKEQRSVLYVPSPLPHNVHPTPFVISWNGQPNSNFFSMNEWRFHQLFFYQVTDFWKAYESISRQLGLRLLKYTQTRGDISVIGTNGLTIPRSLRMVSILRWKRDDVYCVDFV